MGSLTHFRVLVREAARGSAFVSVEAPVSELVAASV